MIVTSAACQTIWLHKMLSEWKYEQKGLTKILYDNKSVIALTKNPIFYGKSKHINIKFYHIREFVKNEEIELEFCRLEDQVVDIFTKSLKTDVFEKLNMMFGVIDFTTRFKGDC